MRKSRFMFVTLLALLVLLVPATVLAVTVSGKVTENGVGIQGVTVSVSNANVRFSNSTDANGAYTISNVPAGSYAISAEKVGFELDTTFIEPSLNTDRVFNLTMRQTSCSWSGIVRDSAGKPLSDVKITYSGTSRGTYGGALTTDAAGKYSVSGLAKDSYRITLSKPYYLSVSQTLSITKDMPMVDFTMQADTGAFTMTGLVKDNTGKAIPGVSITYSGTGSGSLTTDASGKYTASALQKGSYQFNLKKTGYLYTSQSLTITGDLTTDFVMTPGVDTFNLTGTVKDTTGAPLPGVDVSAQISNQPAKKATTDASGNYSFVGLLEGGCLVSATKPGYTLGSNIIFTISLPTKNYRQDLTMAKAPIVKGVVLDETRKPVSDATITLTAGSLFSLTAKSDASGNFIFVPESWMAVGQTYSLQAAKAGYASIAQNVRITTTGDNPFTLEMKHLPRYSITGAVRAGLRILPGATITIYSGATSLSSVTADATGRYQLSGIYAGEYSVEAKMAGFQTEKKALSISGGNAMLDFILNPVK